MKLFVCCLIAALFNAVTCASVETKLMKFKVEEVLKELNRLKRVEQDTSLMLNVPSDYDEVCSLSALDCFGNNLPLLQGPQNLISKISTSLKSSRIVKAVNFRHKKDGKVAICLDCGSYPKDDSKKFLEELGSVLQKANSRLMETTI